MKIFKTILQWYSVLTKIQYNADGIITIHTTNFKTKKDFINAYDTTRLSTGLTEDIKWRTHTALWVAEQSSKLEGDFVECGVNKGFLSKAIVTYLDFNKLNKTFYLLDTFEGVELKQFTEKELKTGNPQQWKYGNTFEFIKESFKDYNKVKIIKGVIPDTLNKVDSKQIAYLSIDMNCAYPEIKTIEFFWSKMVKGGMILLDDYAYDINSLEQCYAFNEFANKHNIKILTLATGQGLIIK